MIWEEQDLPKEHSRRMRTGEYLNQKTLASVEHGVVRWLDGQPIKVAR